MMMLLNTGTFIFFTVLFVCVRDLCVKTNEKYNTYQMQTCISKLFLECDFCNSNSTIPIESNNKKKYFYFELVKDLAYDDLVLFKVLEENNNKFFLVREVSNTDKLKNYN